MQVTFNNQGGGGGNGVIGGNGASATAINAVSGSSNGGSLNLSQTATGGNGGIAFGGVSGTPGNAISNLAINQSGPASATITSRAVAGGNAGGLSAAPAATGQASLDVTSTGTFINLIAEASGGGGGAITSFGGNNSAANGGTGSVSLLRGVATTPGQVVMNLQSTATGGSGGIVQTGGGNGGNGAAASLLDVIEASASAASFVNMTQTAKGGGGGGRSRELAELVVRRPHRSRVRSMFRRSHLLAPPQEAMVERRTALAVERELAATPTPSPTHRTTAARSTQRQLPPRARAEEVLAALQVATAAMRWPTQWAATAGASL